MFRSCGSAGCSFGSFGGGIEEDGGRDYRRWVYQ